MTFAARDVDDGHRPSARQGDDVGQVVLAARVAVVDRLEPAGEVRVGAAITPVLISRIARCFGVASLCSTIARTRAVVVAHDAAVTRRIVELDRQQRQRAVARMPHDRSERLGARQRIGAEQHERHAVGRKLRQRLRERMSGAQRRILQRPAKIGIGKTLRTASPP